MKFPKLSKWEWVAVGVAVYLILMKPRAVSGGSSTLGPTLTPPDAGDNGDGFAGGGSAGDFGSTVDGTDYSQVGD